MQVHNQFILVRGGEKRTAPVTTMRATKVFALCLLAFCKAKSQWLEQKYQLQQHGMKEFSYLTFYFKTKKYKQLLFRKLFIDCVLRCGKLATLTNLFWATFTFKLEFKASLTMFVVNSAQNKHKMRIFYTQASCRFGLEWATSTMTDSSQMGNSLIGNCSSGTVVFCQRLDVSELI